ncbi:MULTISPECIES: Dps family protein [Spirosoma]|uniref:DNA starvation/stationary phase protection protein n=1 Tax=Spirosoma liriopis TaxID=2937440 RepID=A0ABT0HJ40_9BACT|nr:MULTISPECIES: DNA starvation/stationary phase protection protein [Spirosoma]MCK8492162.1 DNA starvation/stationary phase protection protein [Spirosoma liriopis]UHG91581.1 DNA starvation/stationary phase protection protein [Spirosoma oryzicola]
MNAITHIEALDTPSDLKEKGREKVAEAINRLVADSFALYIKTKNYHWHMSGRHFRDYHLLLDEQADQIFATIDPLAERVRKIGGNTIRSVAHIAQLQRVKDNDEDFVAPKDMLADLIDENKKMAKNMRDAHQICDDAEDVATASLLENYIDETERRTWFLFETTRELN